MAVAGTGITDIPPVAWTPERAARGAAPDRGPRCPEPSCPVRYPGGGNRPCPDHAPPVPALARPAVSARVREQTLRAIASWKRTYAPGETDPPKPAPEPRATGTTVPPWVRHGTPPPAVMAHAGLATGTGTAPGAAPAVTAHAGLAAGTGAAPQPEAGQPCQCGCGELVPSWPLRPGRRYLDSTHRKRQQRRDERARLRELTAAARAVVPARPVTVPPLRSAASVSAVVPAARSLATVS
jgi:hypothetical protein